MSSGEPANGFNPFAVMQMFVSISTAKAVPRSIASSPIKELVCKPSKLRNYKKDSPSKKFHENQQENVQEKRTIIKLEGKKREVKSNGRGIIESRHLSGQIIVIRQGQSLCMEAIPCKPLSPLSIAWSKPEGLLRKTNMLRWPQSCKKKCKKSSPVID